MSVTISGMRASSIFQVSYGGTGVSELTSGSLLVGNGTDPVNLIAPGADGQILTVVSGAWTVADNAGGSGGGASSSLTKTFAASGIAVGQVVALSGGLVVADNSDRLKSNVIGVASAVDGANVTVNLFGEVETLSASLYQTTGSEMYLGSSGSVTTYENIGSGKYITQVGFISDNAKVILQPRVFGQKA